MQAATHLAGAVLTLTVAQGLGLEVGPWEFGAAALGALLPDIDTTTAGAGRYVRPLSAWIEGRWGHRTVTHSLAFAAAVSAPLWLLSPPVGLALFLGILSHLILDTMNVNGLPWLLWPWRHTFWFLPSRGSRIRYGSPQETGLAVGVALSGVLLWPLSEDSFGTAARRLIATPETAVTDYVRWRDTREVFAVLEGFNADTQERLTGRYRVVEALGREGVLLEDGAGNLLQASRDGQVVAYRLRVYPGEPLTVLDSRVSIGGRLLRDVLAAVPRGARAVFTGELELSAPVSVPPPDAGTFPRVRGGDRLTLHAARPVDLAPYAASYVVAGSLVVRVEHSGAGPGPAFTLPARAARTEARTVRLEGLPSLAGVLVERGARVLEGQPLAQYVRAGDLAALDARIAAKEQALTAARAALDAGRRVFEARRDALTAQLAPVEREAATLRTLYGLGAEPRVRVEEAQARESALRADLDTLSAEHAARAAAARDRVNALALEARQLREARARAAAAQVVRSPVSGEVAEVRVRDATARGVSVEVVIVSEIARPAGS